MNWMKTTAKKSLSILLSVLLAMLLFPAAAFAFESGQGRESASDAEAAAASEQQAGLADASLDKNQDAAVDSIGQSKDGAQAELAGLGQVTLDVKDSVFNLENNPYVDIDGNAVKATGISGGVSIEVPLPAEGQDAARFLTYYLYNKSYSDSTSTDYDYQNASYPTSMYVWELSYDSESGIYSATRIGNLDNVLKYAGCAVRTVKPQGIRLVTSVPSGVKAALKNGTLGGFEGYTLEETGTIVQWDDKLGGDSLTESKTTMKGNAYVRSSGADPIYKSGNGEEKYTNVLTGFSDEQCKPLLSLRSYAKVSKDGEVYYLYGGTVHRSIGYIASQNTSEFGKGTAGYRFIWNAVHAAYGSSLDSALGYVDWDIRAHVDSECQTPELPWGCESLALTNTLRGYGYSLYKTEIYDNYLSHSSWDFAHAYAGDAYNEIGVGLCMPPALADAANRYLVTHGARERAFNITGASFETVCDYIDQGYPVITWSTSFLDSPSFFGDYIDGYRAYVLVHCIPVVGHNGYDSVTVSCSGNGCRLTHDYSLFASIYDQCGRCAVVII